MKFSEIPGNGQIKNKLVRTVLDQRVSHAQLFSDLKTATNSHWQLPMPSLLIARTNREAGTKDGGRGTKDETKMS